MPETKSKYWDADTDKAIILYNKSEDHEERERLFTESIYPALDKLTENVINVHKFVYFDTGYESVKHDCITYLTMQLHRFNEEKGLGFSYFNISARNYLIQVNNKNYKNFNRHLPINFNTEDDDDSSIANEMERVFKGKSDSELLADFDKEERLFLEMYHYHTVTKPLKDEKMLKVLEAAKRVIAGEVFLTGKNPRRIAFNAIAETAGCTGVYVGQTLRRLTAHWLRSQGLVMPRVNGQYTMAGNRRALEKLLLRREETGK